METTSTSTLLEKVSQDMKEAMKAQQKDRLSVLRMLKSALLENKTSAAPKNEMEVVISYSKKLKDSLESYPEGAPTRESLLREIEVLKDYLPSAVSEAEVRVMVTKILASLDSPNFGMVMKELSPQIKGRFDGKVASQLVQSMLKKE